MLKKHNPQELDLLLGFFIFSTLKKSNRNWLDFLNTIILSQYLSPIYNHSVPYIVIHLVMNNFFQDILLYSNLPFFYSIMDVHYTRNNNTLAFLVSYHLAQINNDENGDYAKSDLQFTTNQSEASHYMQRHFPRFKQNILHYNSFFILDQNYLLKYRFLYRSNMLDFGKDSYMQSLNHYFLHSSMFSWFHKPFVHYLILPFLLNRLLLQFHIYHLLLLE